MLQVPQFQGNFAADPHIRERRLGLVKLTVVVGVAYFLAARLSIVILAKDGAAMFWPAAGISAGILIALGRDARRPVAIGATAATIAASLMGGRNVFISSIFGLCNAGEALLIAWLIERHVGRRFRLGRFRHVLGFLGAAILATAIFAVGAAAGKLIYDPNLPIWFTWQHWFFADLVGVIAVAPFLIGLIAAVRVPPPRRELIEGGVAVAALVATTGLIIVLLPETWWEMCLLVAALFPMLLWPAARCRPVFAAAAVFDICLMIVSALTFDIGHFNKVNQPADELALNAYISIFGVAVCALILASLFAERAEGARRLQEALAAGSVLAFEWDVGTDRSLRSDNAAQVLGLEKEQLTTGASFVTRINPDDRARFTALLSGLRRDNPSYSTTYRFTRPDGREIWLEDTARAEFDAVGRLVRVSGLGVDVTERRQADIRQAILVAELDHRVKNVLARVVAVAAQTRERSDSIDDFVKTLSGRLQSMASAHALLSQSRWGGVGIADLIRDQLAPHATGTNVTIHGPNITLSAATSQALAMVIHELVTNAVKFGALSTPGGQVSISWEASPGGDGRADLAVEWREIGGPPVTKPTQSGYGSSLIRELIPYELGGAVQFAFDPDGVCCRMTLPLERP
jgi:PAS domain S-box-containing protein